MARPRVFVDTSAFYALLVVDDARHPRAVRVLDRLEAEDAELVTSSLVLQETIALLQVRLGVDAVRRFAEAVVPGLRVEWIGEQGFQAGLTALLAASLRTVSLTDWTSFEVMRRLRIRRAFAFDDDFTAQGFALEG